MFVTIYLVIEISKRVMKYRSDENTIVEFLGHYVKISQSIDPSSKNIQIENVNQASIFLLKMYPQNRIEFQISIGPVSIDAEFWKFNYCGKLAKHRFSFNTSISGSFRMGSTEPIKFEKRVRRIFEKDSTADFGNNKFVQYVDVKKTS